MGTFRLSTGVAAGNPVRVQRWNVSMRAGDDLKVALTVYDDDNATPALVRGARSRLVLQPDTVGQVHGAVNNWGSCWDYGLGWASSGRCENVVPGYAVTVRDGGLNFQMPAAATSRLWHGRYRLGMQVDLLDGTSTQIEGILQIRERDGIPFGHETSFFQLDRSVLDGDEPLADAVDEYGVPIDADGFKMTGDAYLIGGMRPESEYYSSILGSGPLAYIVLADDAGESDILGSGTAGHTFLGPLNEDSSILGVSTLQHMVLALGYVPPPPPPPTIDGGGLLGLDGAPLEGEDAAFLLPLHYF